MYAYFIRLVINGRFVTCLLMILFQVYFILILESKANILLTMLEYKNIDASTAKSL